MGIAIIIAIIIAYFVMAITFRSFLNPFIIMFSLPVAAIGALFGLFITGRSLGIPAMMGMLMLVGIVLTNAIVLIALVDQLRRKGMSTHEALIQGGSTRLRPILMTAVATMLALLPLALGLSQGTIIAAELATVVIGGLFTSTLLTLIVVPVVYSLFHNKEHRTVEK
jgi:HAE1 family hydrophobic/amphiphilic exporter-1